MRYKTFLFLTILISFTLTAQDIVPNLVGLRSQTKDNGYNDKEVDYFDSKGNLIFTITYDKQGKFEDTPFGVAIIEKKYDNSSNLIERRFYDQNQKLFRTEMIGPAIEKFKYDNNNNLIETVYCDEKGEPLDNGFSILLFKYDNNKNVIQERYLDNKRNLTDDACIFKFKYDSRNRKVEEKRFDKYEKLIKVKGTTGSSIIRFKYDDQDRIAEQSFYNEEDQLIDGEAIVRYNYDKKPPNSPAVFNDSDSQWVEQIYYNKDDKEIRRNFRYLPKDKK